MIYLRVWDSGSKFELALVARTQGFLLQKYLYLIQVINALTF